MSASNKSPAPNKSPAHKSPVPTSSPLARFAIVAALIAAATGAGASTALFTTASAQQAPGLSSQAYLLRCWQDSVQILNVRETQALQSLNQPFERGLTLDNADGSRRILAPMGDSLCIVEFTVAKS